MHPDLLESILRSRTGAKTTLAPGANKKRAKQKHKTHSGAHLAATWAVGSEPRRVRVVESGTEALMLWRSRTDSGRGSEPMTASLSRLRVGKED